MAQITNFFLGANSGSGFQNLFSEIMDPETAFDIMILKGGPGVGTFSWFHLGYTLVFAVVIMLWGMVTFNRVQRSFMDVI